MTFTEGRLAGKSALRYVRDLKGDLPQLDDNEINKLKQTVFQPLENYKLGRNEIVAGTGPCRRVICCRSTACSGWRS